MRVAHMKAVECYSAALPYMRPAGLRVSIPFSATLLHGVLRDRPQFQDIVMTAQHREFSELSDDDVTSFLRQLKSLGLLDLPASPTNK